MLRSIDGPGANPEQLTWLSTLADAVEPVKDYTRGATAPAEATSATPLNRVVDAVPLESDVARRFAEQVDRLASSSCRDADAAAQLRAQLSAWRDNDARLQPPAQRSFLVKEAAATSQDLSAVAAVGLAAPEFAAKGGAAADDGKPQQLAAAEHVPPPQAPLP